MKIIINAATIRFGGALQVALSFINECSKINENEYHVIGSSVIKNSLINDEYPSNFKFYFCDFGRVNLFKIFLISKQLRKIEKAIKPNCVITTSGPSYWRSNAPHVMGYNLPLYIYRESPYFSLLSKPDKIKLWLKKKLHKWFFKREADAFIVQTEDVNNRVRDFLKTNKVFTIYNTYNHYFENTQVVNSISYKSSSERIILLTISAYYRHKNIELIPEIIDELRKEGYYNINFIVTIDNAIFNRIFGDKYKATVINLGSVKPMECPSLYNSCDIMLLPSLAECFSASYAEAMKMQIPIITSDLSFAHDICGNAALYFEPMNATMAANEIIKLITDKKLQKLLIENGINRLKHFNSASERARKILNICKEITKNYEQN